jgi:hypothetical protein
MKRTLAYASALLMSAALCTSTQAENLIPDDLLRPAPQAGQPVAVTPYEQPVNSAPQNQLPIDSPFQAATVTPQSSGLPVLSGGVGSDEVAAMQAVKGEYNLHIMSANKLGQYTGEIHIIIKDKAGNVVLDTEGGPLFYAKLPSGRYHVEGIRDGVSKKQTITIAGNKSAHIHFGW